MTLKEFRDVLLTVGIPVYHYEAQEEPKTYIVWGEYRTMTNNADNRRREKVMSVQVDLFTKVEFDPVQDALESILSGAGIAFDGPETDYDGDTGHIHNSYDCEVVDAGSV